MQAPGQSCSPLTALLARSAQQVLQTWHWPGALEDAFAGRAVAEPGCPEPWGWRLLKHPRAGGLRSRLEFSAVTSPRPRPPVPTPPPAEECVLPDFSRPAHHPTAEPSAPRTTSHHSAPGGLPGRSPAHPRSSSPHSQALSPGPPRPFSSLILLHASRPCAGPRRHTPEESRERSTERFSKPSILTRLPW